MNTKNAWILALAALLGLTASPAQATLITFDDAIYGSTHYSFDADLDGKPDAVFSTSDPSGFRTAGPGPNMSYIQEPGLEGTTYISPDLRVDFNVGAQHSLGFGFAMNAYTTDPDLSMLFSIFDDTNNLLASTTVMADYTGTLFGHSSFPEALVSLPFSGTAQYATFDFNSAYASRYIIDNFNGTFGTRDIVEPSSALILLTGVLLIGLKSSLKAYR
jgi:hypothetical protein